MLAFLLSFFALPAFAQNTPVDPDAPTHDTKSAAEIDGEWQTSVAKYDGARAAILRQVELQANDGPYRADWETLRKYWIPQWYKDAKFGIFILEMAWPADGRSMIHALGAAQEAKGAEDHKCGTDWVEREDRMASGRRCAGSEGARRHCSRQVRLRI